MDRFYKIYCNYDCFFYTFYRSVFPQAFVFWDTGVTGYILCGITGKLAVAMFAVILGFFAAYVADKKDFSLGKYICRRYFRFFCCISLMILMIKLLFHAYALWGIHDEFYVIEDNFLVGEFNLINNDHKGMFFVWQ